MSESAIERSRSRRLARGCIPADGEVRPSAEAGAAGGASLWWITTGRSDRSRPKPATRPSAPRVRERAGPRPCARLPRRWRKPGQAGLADDVVAFPPMSATQGDQRGGSVADAALLPTRAGKQAVRRRRVGDRRAQRFREWGKPGTWRVRDGDRPHGDSLAGDRQVLDELSDRAMLSAHLSICCQSRLSPKRPPKRWKNNREIGGHWFRWIAPAKTL